MFDLKTVKPDQPLTEDPFYAWLNANVSRMSVRGWEDIKDYLASLGFRVGEDRITEEQLKILEYVHEMWCRLTPFFGTQKRADLFQPGLEYYLAPNGKTGVTRKLYQMVEDAGWIYTPAPDNLYFELIDNRLYAKYQQIIGSRFICFLED